jgi:uncharacterized membrane protein
MTPETQAPPQEHQTSIPDSFGLERLVFFSDAVFAIAITLLVLEIRLPGSVETLSNEQLLASLLSIGPRYLAYIVSFLVIGSAWISHHRKFRYIRDYDRWLVRINLILLMVVAFIPFPTAVLSESGNRTATIFYALTIVVMSLFNTLLWIYASGIGGLVDPHMPGWQVRLETLRGLAIPIVFLLSIGLAFWDTSLAKYSWLLTAPLLYYTSKILKFVQPKPTSQDKT